MSIQYISYNDLDQNITTIESTIEQMDTERTIDIPPVPETDAILSKTEIQINNAINLPFGNEKRSARCGDGCILLHDRKQPTEKDRHLILLILHKWGWSNPAHTYKERVRIAKAASYLVAYDQGYRVPFGYTQINVWDSKIEAILDHKRMLNPSLAPDQRGTTSYCDRLETNNPGYLHELFRYAIRTQGSKSSFAVLAIAMNQKSRVPTEHRPVINISRRMLNKWFILNGGKEISSVEKPLDTDNHKIQRIKWVRQHYFKLTNPYVYVAYMDENFFTQQHAGGK